MNKKIEAILKYEDENNVREVMEDRLIRIVVNRINELEAEDRVYVYDEILNRLKL